MSLRPSLPSCAGAQLRRSESSRHSKRDLWANKLIVQKEGGREETVGGRQGGRGKDGGRSREGAQVDGADAVTHHRRPLDWQLPAASGRPCGHQPTVRCSFLEGEPLPGVITKGLGQLLITDPREHPAWQCPLQALSQARGNAQLGARPNSTSALSQPLWVSWPPFSSWNTRPRGQSW